MKNILILFLSLTLSMGTTSCGLFGGKSKSQQQAQASEQQGKKKKPKRCKLKSCHVRMTHMHNGSEYLGKKGWFLKPLFYSNKDPKYGEGLKKSQRDPHQWNKRRDKN
jgi:hypothetical protein